MFTQENLEKALITNLLMHSTPYKSEIRRMITMTGGMGSVTKYRAATSKAIIQFFKGKRVLDPCVGWGGRMLGTLASSNEGYYIGCEPDINTYNGLMNIKQDSCIPSTVRKRATIINKPAELAMDEIKSMEKFDIVLTSPPYFNLELYTNGEQSTNNHTTWDDWTSKWLKPLILNCLSCLNENGVSCWSVKNFKSDKKYPLADVVKEIHNKAGWKVVKTVVMSGSGRPGTKRIEEGKESRGSEEETFCFKRVTE
jgi:16S rRNA G966 N2-methylase RsmD